MDVQSLRLSKRTVIGKKVKQLRRQGIVPVHVYGSGIDPHFFQAEALVLQKLLPRVGTNIPLSIDADELEGENICFVREVQRHAVTEDVLHVDFLRVDVSQTIQAEVPIILTGNAPAVREQGGTLLQPLQNLLVESLPMNVPPSVEIDISGLEDFEIAVYVSGLTVASNVTILTNPDELIARVSAPRIEVEPVVEEEEGIEGAEEAEGEGSEGESEE